MSTTASGFRIEKDFSGAAGPIDAYYGVQTLRAIENFPSPVPDPPALIRAMAIVKKAAALANRDTGHLDAKIADAISAAADEVIAGSSTTSSSLIRSRGRGDVDHMNTNEVLANRALEILGAPRGRTRPSAPTAT